MVSDGANVNKLFLNLLAETKEEEQCSWLVDLGMCGLHTLHNGLQHGEKTSGWELKLLLNTVYKMLDKSPARTVMKKIWLVMKVTMSFNFVFIDGLKMQGWL